MMSLKHRTGWFVERLSGARPLDSQEDFKPITAVNADFSEYETDSGRVGICATWLGHAGYLIQLPIAGGSRGVRIAFDPVFAEYAYSSNWLNGLRRRLRAPCTVEQLPDLDFVIISHNHYDHCDVGALVALWKSPRQSSPLRYLVPLGVKYTLTSEGIPESQIRELDWWDSVTYRLPLAPNADIVITCTPCQHNSGRGFLDQKRSLWASWAIQQKDSAGTIVASVYFAGDTGYQTAVGPCPAFREIGENYGPFDLAMIPIWRGATLSFLGQLGYQLADDTHLATTHASPEDAVLLARDVRARHSLAMHFATWAGSDDEANEPLLRLKRARGGDWWEEGGFGALDVGQTIVLPTALTTFEGQGHAVDYATPDTTQE
ncbi:hypothetical protein HYDPIDRAFT_179945 [Hydnomerulius pinastri MD-312]|nr:hypothetical protein HYDPIDRAFT_179945 [Hydnomerulius pinastri MD-312]